MRKVLACVALAACSSPSEDVTAIGKDVQVIRDEWGVPHVYAHSGEDAAFALGYVTAQDRLFQLDLDRRRALGREAELFGASALSDDRIARTIGFAQLGEAAAEDLRANDPEVYRTLSAYASGVNAFIASGEPLSPEFADLGYVPEPWRVADTMALLKAQLFLLAAHPETDLLGYAVSVASGQGVYLDLFTPDPLEPEYITPGFPGSVARTDPAAAHEDRTCGETADTAARTAEALAHFARRGRIGPVAASNNFVLCGQKSASGGTLLATSASICRPTSTSFISTSTIRRGRSTRPASAFQARPRSPWVTTKRPRGA
jgi:penicillin amidase